MKNALVVFVLLAACRASDVVDGGAVDLATVDAAPTADRVLLDDLEQRTFRYFWNGAHPTSGMARERSTSGDLVTTGGTGFGVEVIVAATDRGFVSRADAVGRLIQICAFLSAAPRFHGAFSHWLDGATGAVIPFSTKDDGGDLVETSYLMAGLLAARAYFTGSGSDETALRTKITELWEAVEWSFYASRGDGKLYWHWSPDYDWQMNVPIVGWNEALITYILAMGSPTYPLSPTVYESTWVPGLDPDATYEGYTLPLGPAFGGPMFLAHYSFLGLDPRRMQDTRASYWERDVIHTLINRSYCLHTAPASEGYAADLWGLTASDNPDGYDAQDPQNDNGTIAPTAALSSMPYEPYYALQVARRLASDEAIWGEYGPMDALNPSRSWIDTDWLAIDEGPIAIMVENYRSGLLWRLTMSVAEVQAGLAQAGIVEPTNPIGFYLAIPERLSGAIDLARHPDVGLYQLDVAIPDDSTYAFSIENGATVWSGNVAQKGVSKVSFDVAPGSYTAHLAGAAFDVLVPIVVH